MWKAGYSLVCIEHSLSDQLFPTVTTWTTNGLKDCEVQKYARQKFNKQPSFTKVNSEWWLGSKLAKRGKKYKRGCLLDTDVFNSHFFAKKMVAKIDIPGSGCQVRHKFRNRFGVLGKIQIRSGDNVLDIRSADSVAILLTKRCTRYTLLTKFCAGSSANGSWKKKEYGSDPKHIGEANKHVVTCEFRQQRKGSQSESKNICQITHSFRKLTIGGCTMGVGSCRHEHGRSN